MLGFHFGLRLVDCCDLQVKSISDPEQFTVWTVKTNTRISFPLTKEGVDERLEDSLEFELYDKVVQHKLRNHLYQMGDVMDQIRCLLPDPKGKYCFPVMRRFSKQGSHLGVNAASLMFVTCCREAGLKNHSFHGLCHSFARKLRSLGLNLNTLAAMLGHSSTRMTQHYTAER